MKLTEFKSLTGQDDNILDILNEHAAQPPAPFVIKHLEAIGFPNQYINWMANKILKDIKINQNNIINRQTSPDTFKYLRVIPGVDYEVNIQGVIKRDSIENAKEPLKTHLSNVDTLWDAVWHGDLLGDKRSKTWFDGRDLVYRRQATNIKDWIIGSQAGQPHSFPDTMDEMKLERLSLKKANELAIEWHNELNPEEKLVAGEKEEGYKFMTFEDGFYWQNLMTNTSEYESKYMGHCGTDTQASTLFSLRKNGLPHVTMSYLEKDKRLSEPYKQEKPANKLELKDGTYCQLKGKQNKKPVEKYHKYIVELFIKLQIRDYSNTYLQENDFHIEDLNDELFNKLKDSGLVPEDIILFKDYKNGDPNWDKLKSNEKAWKKVSNDIVANDRVDLLDKIL